MTASYSHRPGSVPTPRRVHISPVGFYHDRIVDAIKRGMAEIVYLLAMADPQKDKAASYRKAVVADLRKWRPDLPIHIVRTNIFDLSETAEAICHVVKHEQRNGNAIFVNISPGSKIEAVAASIACMAWGTTAYYVQIEHYELAPRESTRGQDTPRRQPPVQGRGVTGIETIPLYRIPRLTDAQLVVLQACRAGPLTKRDLARRLLDEGEIPTTSKPAQNEAEKPVSAKEYGRLATIIEPLLDPPAKIELTGERKNLKVSLSELGELTLRIFKPREPTIEVLTAA